MYSEQSPEWRNAMNQINQIQIPKSYIVANQNQPKNKGFEQIFKRSSSLLDTIIPTKKQISYTQKNVPDSVKMLDAYSQKIGFLPMGEIYQSPGSKYIGRIKQQTANGETFYKGFHTISEEYIDSPDIYQNLCFKANKTISKWNDFVKSQSQLGQFLSQIQTQEGKKQLIYKLAKTSNQTTCKLKMLSSLYHYYVDQKKPIYNLLQLPSQFVQQLIAQLSTQGTIDNVYANVMRILQYAKRQDLVYYIKNYYKNMMANVRMTLSTEQYQQFVAQNDQNAYVPEQMISSVYKNSSNWYKIYKDKHTKLGSTLITTEWNPNAPWFRSVNYIKF